MNPRRSAASTRSTVLPASLSPTQSTPSTTCPSKRRVTDFPIAPVFTAPSNHQSSLINHQSIALCGLLASLAVHRIDAALAASELKRPATFPHRIWAACDFEGNTHSDYAWFGKPETNSVPNYPGNRTALRAGRGPYADHAALMAGVNPVPGPRMGKQNWLFLRYFLKGGADATLQHFSLTSEDNWHVNLTGLTNGHWSDLAVNFTAHARRNDGSVKPFVEGERMDDFKMFAGTPAEAARYELLLDDILFFANDASFSSPPSIPVKKRITGPAISSSATLHPPALFGAPPAASPNPAAAK
jgi:hypothetical protein